LHRCRWFSHHQPDTHRCSHHRCKRRFRWDIAPAPHLASPFRRIPRAPFAAIVPKSRELTVGLSRGTLSGATECRTWSKLRSRFCCSRRHARPPFLRKVWDVRKTASIQVNLTVSIVGNSTAKAIRGWMGAAVAIRVSRLVRRTGKTERSTTRSSETIAPRSMPLRPMRALDGKPGCARRVSKKKPPRRLPVRRPSASSVSDQRPDSQKQCDSRSEAPL
jgi:hypothetical protein